jgi:methylglyoxal reductase
VIPTRRLGRNGPALSVIGYGGWEAGGGGTWGPNPSEAELIATIRAGFERGVNWVDTAEVYGGGGGSEELLGRALRGHDDVRVVTTVGPQPDGSGVRPAEIRSALAGSLQRLEREKADVYLLHWPDPDVPLDESWGALCELRDEGLAEAIGLSNFPRADVERCAAIGAVDCVEVHLSALDTRAYDDIESLARAKEIGILCYGALGYGLLAGAVGADTRFDDWRGGEYGMDDFWVADSYATYFEPVARERNLRAVEELRGIAAELGVTLAQLALAWCIAQPGVTAALMGTRSRGHLDENLAATAAAAALTEADLRRIAGARQPVF